MKVEIYSKELCPNCKTAENLTISANIKYKMLKMDIDYTIKEMRERIGERVTEMPQIFVDNKYIGGIKEYREFLKNQESDEISFDQDDL